MPMSTDPLADADAVRAVLDGDPDAYAVLVRRYQDVLFAHAYRMVGHRDDAADLVQQAFVTGFRRLATCREPAKVGGWLFRILANGCRDHLKSARRRDIPLDVLPALRGDRRSPDAEAARHEIRDGLNEALDALEPEQREAFVLKHVDGRRYDEMASLLGVSVPALKMRVHRAREGLQELLEVYR